MLVSAFIGATAGAFALVTLLPDEVGQATSDTVARRDFRNLDFNGDNVLSRAEYRAVRGDFRDVAADVNPVEMEAFRHRSRAIVLVFGAYDINLRDLLASTSAVSDSCWEAGGAYYRSKVDEQFAEFDLNSDGEVPAAEYTQFRLERLQASFDLWDLDGDGLLTPQDAEQRAAADRVRISDGAERRTFAPDQPEHIRVCQQDVGRFTEEGIRSSSISGFTAADYWSHQSGWDDNGDEAIDLAEYAVHVAG